MTGTDAAPPASSQRERPPLSVPAAGVLTFIAAWLLLDQWLLWQFLGLPLWISLLALPPIALFLWHLMHASGMDAHITLRRLALCLAIAALLLALGGEGRLFYANIDWQVRDAVLRDMALHPWPFVYVEGGVEQLLRAPIGMFLMPSLAFKASGPMAGDMALWVQNSLLLGSSLALGSTLFATRRARTIALATILLFSGLDSIGTLLFHGHWRDHLEFWFATMQFSSHITQAFWVPLHALAGWMAALLFLLWHRGRMALWPLLALLPLTALWSPLALIGAMPFALWAGVSTLAARKLTLTDIGWPALSVIIALPSLGYLAAAPDNVGIRPYPLPLPAWMIFVTLEVLVYAVPLLLASRGDAPTRKAPLLIVTLWLLLCPFVQIGWSLDFMMRTSIPSLALLAVAVAKALDEAPSAVLRGWLAAMLLLGSATGLNEIGRAFAQPPSPRGTCSFFGAWDVNFANYPKGSYLAPVARLPGWLRPDHPTTLVVDDSTPCWEGRWMRPEGV